MSTSPMFACVIPGRPLITEFSALDENRLYLPVVQPETVQNFVITLLKPTLPPAYGVGVYYVIPQKDEWNYVGSVTLESPSGLFRAPWNSTTLNPNESVYIGLCLQPLEVLKDKVTADQIEQRRNTDNARAIATDLYTFIQSFPKIPNDVIERWLIKFEEKKRRDPHFLDKKAA